MMESTPSERQGPTSSDFAEDRQLVERYLAGDRTAGDELTTLLAPVISCVVGRVLGQRPESDREDARQSIWLRVFERLDTWKARCPLSAWVWVVATRRALDIRRDRWHISLSGDLFGELPSKRPEKDYDLSECIDTTISRFPARWQEVLRLVVEGVERQEIAVRMGVARRTIQYWLENMRNELLRCVEGRR